MTSENLSLFDADRDALTQILDGEPRYRLDQLWKGLYVDFAEPKDITSLPAALRVRLAETLPSALEMVTESATGNLLTEPRSKPSSCITPIAQRSA